MPALFVRLIERSPLPRRPTCWNPKHPHPMRRHPFLATATLLMLSLAAPAAELPQGKLSTLSTGTLQHMPAKEYNGHLLAAMLEYTSHLNEPYKGAEPWRRRAIALARRFPAEVNDLLQRPDGSWATPLSLAVQAQDDALVSLLLREGALPFTTQAEQSLSDLPLLPGAKPNAAVAKALEHFCKRYNPLAAYMSHRNKPCAHQEQEPSPHAELSPTLRQLAEGYESTYLGDPRGLPDVLLYEAYRCLTGHQSHVLHVQPLARMVEQPLPVLEGQPRRFRNGYALIHYRARVVRALKGQKPEQSFISWAEQHEGPVLSAPDGQWVELPADAEPMVVDMYNHGFSKPQQWAVEGDTLKLGNIDAFATGCGDKWVKAYEQVIADYPEIRETTSATAEELAAAHALMEQAPCLVRADLLSVEAKDGVWHYHAKLRDPLAGAVIKGILEDWRDLRYTRPQAEAQPIPAGTPVLLVLDTSGESPRVLQALDAVNEAPLFRAINQGAFCPWSKAK